MNRLQSRRDFISQGVAIAGCAYPGAVALAGCAVDSKTGRDPRWAIPEQPSESLPMASLRCGALAPNAHNTQPWLLRQMASSVFDLYVDPARLLPYTDPWYRQTHVSQGTFVEMASIAAANWGLGTEVEYFPEGIYGPKSLRDVPVARLRYRTLGAAVRDPLFDQIERRHCNKRNYEPVAIDASTVGLLTKVGVPYGVRIQVVSESGRRAGLAEIASEAMRVEMEDQQRAGETVKWFRFSREELERRSDGFGLGQNGVSGLKRWVAERFVLDRQGAARAGSAFVDGAVSGAHDQAHSASAFVLMSTSGGTRTDELRAGRAFARLGLTVSQLGLALHPMSQAAEEYADMAPVLARLKETGRLGESETVQMFLRLGEAQAVPHTPRRDLETFLRKAPEVRG